MVFDGHSDIPFDILKRRKNGKNNIFDKIYAGDFKKGGINGAVFAVCADNKNTADLMLNAFIEDSKTSKYLSLSGSKAKIEGILELEGIGYLDTPQEIYKYIEKGVGVISLTWNEKNKFAGGAKSDGDLTKYGKKIIKILEAENIYLDVSHLNDKSLYSVLEFAEKPVIATHSSVRNLCNNPRNLSAAMIKEIALRGGVIGINSYPDFIAENRVEQDINHLSEHVLYAIETAGIDSIGLGLDLCYFENGEYNNTLLDLQRYSDANKIPVCLKKFGLTDEEIEKITFRNWQKLFNKADTNRQTVNNCCYF